VSTYLEAWHLCLYFTMGDVQGDLSNLCHKCVTDVKIQTSTDKIRNHNIKQIRRWKWEKLEILRIQWCGHVTCRWQQDSSGSIRNECWITTTGDHGHGGGTKWGKIYKREHGKIGQIQEEYLEEDRQWKTLHRMT